MEQVAAATDGKAEYIRNRALDDAFYAKLLTDFLVKYGHATRSDIDRLLKPKLSDALTDRQRYNKISNLQSKLRRRGAILNTGSDAAPRWQLAEKDERKSGKHEGFAERMAKIPI